MYWELARRRDSVKIQMYKLVETRIHALNIMGRLSLVGKNDAKAYIRMPQSSFLPWTREPSKSLLLCVTSHLSFSHKR